MIALKVGDLTAQLGTSPELRDVRLGGQPTLDRVSLTVRDPLWVTITGSRAKRTVETSDDHVYVRDQWSYPVQGSSLDAVWEVRLDHDRLDVRAEVTAQGSVGVNRASLCLLHPLESVGTRVRLRHPNGTDLSSFATEVNPHRVFEEVTGMTFALPDGRRVDLDFGGDLFETEDHRNWSDAGWKTYSPPLDHRSPRMLNAGEQIVTTMIATITGPSNFQALGTRRPHDSITIGPGRVGRLPRLGWGAGVAVSPAAKRLVDAHGFLFAEIVDGDSAADRLRCVDDQAKDCAVPLRLILVAPLNSLPAWGTRIRAATNVASVCLADPVTHAASDALNAALRMQLTGSGIAVAGGSRGYLAEFGRAADCDAGADIVQVSVSAEVHHSDPELVMDTTRAHPSITAAVRRRAGSRPVLIMPVSLAQRMTMHERASTDYAPWSSRFPHDPRAGRQYGAAWLLAATARLADADEIGFFSLAPGAGLIDDTGQITPAGVLSARLAAIAGAALVDCQPSDCRRAAALAVEHEGSVTAWVANLCATPAVVELRANSRSQMLDLAPYEVRALDLAVDQTAPQPPAPPSGRGTMPI